MRNTDLSTKDALTAARDLIAKGWCQRHSALNAQGIPVDFQSEHAVRFCVHGAVARVCGADSGAQFNACRKALRAARRRNLNMTISEWNDAPERTQADVLAYLDRAIVAAS